MTEREEAEAEPGAAPKTDFTGTREERAARAPCSLWRWPQDAGNVVTWQR